MNDNPIHNIFQFLLGTTPSQTSLGELRWFTLILYWALFAGGIAVAVTVWRRDPAQRNARNILVFLLRFTMASMWFSGTLWKLPLPVSDAFKFWLGATVKYSSFGWHAAFMNLFVQHIALVQTPVYLLELCLTASLMLGFAVRLAGTIGALFILNLLIGLYNDPTEWVWTYVGLLTAHAMFVLDAAGRSLGIDAILQRTPPLTRWPVLERALASVG